MTIFSTNKFLFRNGGILALAAFVSFIFLLGIGSLNQWFIQKNSVASFFSIILFVTFTVLGVYTFNSQLIEIDESSGDFSIRKPGQKKSDVYKRSELKGFFIICSSRGNDSLEIQTQNGKKISIVCSTKKRLEIIDALEKYCRLLEINKPFNAPAGPFDPNVTRSERILSQQKEAFTEGAKLVEKNKTGLTLFVIILVLAITFLIGSAIYIASNYR